MALWAGMPVMAQGKNGWQNESSYFSFSAGVSVPIMCYASSNVNNKDAGFAKPGFSFNISYAYRFGNYGGVAGSVFYGLNKAGSSSVKTLSTPGSYRYFGLMAGPLLTKNFSSRWEGDARFLGGIGRLYTPRLVQGDAAVLEEKQATAFVWGGGLGMRYNLSDNTFLTFRTDHLNMQPQLKLKPGETGKTEQHIVLINVDAGIGFRF